MPALSGDELAVLNAIRKRLEKGKQQYGQLKLKHDTRNWLNELQEELLDACVYLECEKRKRKRVPVAVHYAISINGERVKFRPVSRKFAVSAIKDARAYCDLGRVKLIRITRYRRGK